MFEVLILLLLTRFKFVCFSVSLPRSNCLHYCAAKPRSTIDHELHLMPAARHPPGARFITAQRHRMNPNGLKISLAKLSGGNQTLLEEIGSKPMLHYNIGESRHGYHPECR